MSKPINPWTLRSVRNTVAKGDMYHLALRITNGNVGVRRAIWTVLDEKLLSKQQLKELEKEVKEWIDLKKGNKAFIAKLRAEDYLDSV